MVEPAREAEVIVSGPNGIERVSISEVSDYDAIIRHA